MKGPPHENPDYLLKIYWYIFSSRAQLSYQTLPSPPAIADSIPLQLALLVLLSTRSDGLLVTFWPPPDPRLLGSAGLLLEAVRGQPPSQAIVEIFSDFETQSLIVLEWEFNCDLLIVRLIRAWICINWKYYATMHVMYYLHIKSDKILTVFSLRSKDWRAMTLCWKMLRRPFAVKMIHNFWTYRILIHYIFSSYATTTN